METLLLDVRFALRSLRRRATFTAVAVATIALSIGAGTAIFSVVDGVLFRSLPYHDAGRLVSIWQTDTIRKKQAVLSTYWDRVPLDYTDFIVWRQKQTSYSGVGVWSGFGGMLTGLGEPEAIIGSRVSPGLFEVLGVRPILGRTFLPGEDVVGGPLVTILSYETWMTRFGGRRDIIGSPVRFDDKSYEIVGVLPPKFTLERGKPGAPFWIPAGQNKGDVGQHNRGFRAIGRLQPGVTLEQASTETEHLLNATDPSTSKGIRISDFVRDETRDVRAPLLVLLGAVGLLLLIACVNVATLMLGEASSRDAEMSARAALGASRSRLVRLLLTESLLLSAVGSAFGVLLAWWGTRVIVALAPERIPGIQTAHVDARVLAVALAAATITGLLFGLAPAMTLATSGPAALLRSGQTVRGRGGLQRVMIATELALSVVLLVGAGLLTRSLQKLSAVDPGFRTENMLTMRMSFAGRYWEDSIRVHTFYNQVMPRLRAIPGVSDVTLTTSVPFAGGSSSSPYLLPGEGDAERSSHKHEVQQRTIAANYFAVMGIPVIAGRAFSSEDRAGSTLVAIISEAAARRDFPTESAVGKQVMYQGSLRTIVGVVRDVKFRGLGAADQPAIYTPISQRQDLLDIVIRARADAATMTSAVRAAVRELDPAFVPGKAEIMDDLVRRSFGEERFRTALIALFGAIAAVLAAVGMYGVTSRAVSRRTREVGIRVALGATPRTVIAMIVNQTLAGVTIGVLIGAATAALASRVLVPYLFGVTSHDPATYGAIFMFLGLVSVLASWVPARRAGQVEPAIVLRGE
jgi:putative ABC transport system permease protein